MLRAKCTACDVVWLVSRDDPSGGVAFHRGRDAVDVVVDLPVPGVVAHDPRPVHHKLVCMAWNPDTIRYELVGGIVLAVGIPGRTRLSPVDDGDEFDLEAVPTSADGKWSFQPRLLEKATETAQWHSGNAVPGATSITIDADTLWMYSVWDVSPQYARLAHGIVENITSRTSRMFTPSPGPWGRMDQRGFIRQSELRFGWPGMPMPGLCIEECGTNRVDHTFWETIVRFGTLLCGFDADKFWQSVPEDDPKGHVRGLLDEYTRTRAVVELDDVPPRYEDIDAVDPLAILRTLDALTTACLGLVGAHYGYNHEKASPRRPRCPPRSRSRSRSRSPSRSRSRLCSRSRFRLTRPACRWTTRRCRG